MIILVALIFPLLTMLRQTTDYLITQIDYRTAQNRVFSVQSLLRYPVYYCGMGLPVSTEEYKAAFNNSRFQPFNWAGPVSVVNSSSGNKNGELRIVYAKPEPVQLKSNFVYIKQGKRVTLTKKISTNSIITIKSGVPNNIRNCIVFKSSFPSANPLIVRSVNSAGTSLEVESFKNRNFFKLHKNDTMHVLSAMRIFCKNGILYTADFKISGDQPRVAGIDDIRFDFNKDKNTITTYLLVRGNHKFDKIRDIIGIERCAKEIAEEWISKKSNYQRYAVKTVWRLPNCLSTDIFFQKDVTEQ